MKTRKAKPIGPLYPYVCAKRTSPNFVMGVTLYATEPDIIKENFPDVQVLGPLQAEYWDDD